MTLIRPLLTRVLLALVFCAVAGHSSIAETWPTRPIALVIGFAGGTGDTIGRPFAEFASKELGQPVVVESRPAGGGIVAALGVSRAQPDGYTIGLQAVGPMILRPIMDPTVEFDSEKDFSPIALLIDTPNVILGGAQFSARSVRETVDWARQNPGRVTIGHPGPGTMGHLAALLLASDAKFTGNYIAYRNVTLMVTDLVGGQIDVGVAAYNPQLKAARVLAVMTAEPVAFLPGVPSMRQAGFPGVYASTWFALFGPPNLPPDIVAKLNTVANAFLRSDDGRKRLNLIGVRPLGGSPERLAKTMAEDKIQWSKVIKDANIKLNDQL
ncbi:MAG: tripartite tricarboxylate transporter substrate binding protein [Rhizobiales bacterium]|nr:tripartite tricarboxylate transporter substrate binding protein [Hyphomicrobiales bacterium]